MEAWPPLPFELGCPSAIPHAFASASQAFLRVSDLSLSPNAVLDLSGGSLIVFATPATRDAVLQPVTNAIKAGSASNWAGKGITNSKAQSDATHHTGLAVVLNDRGNNTPILKTFNGINVGVNDILVKYTWNGDVNLDGIVDAADYFLVDSGSITRTGTLAAEEAPVQAEDVVVLKTEAAKPQQAPSVLQRLFSVKSVL